MTKQAYLAALRQYLPTAYPWAKEPERLDRFMESARRTVYGEKGQTAILDKTSSASVHVWRAIGCKGVPTYKALRALPED